MTDANKTNQVEPYFEPPLVSTSPFDIHPDSAQSATLPEERPAQTAPAESMPASDKLSRHHWHSSNARYDTCKDYL